MVVQPIILSPQAETAALPKAQRKLGLCTETLSPTHPKGRVAESGERHSFPTSAPSGF